MSLDSYTQSLTAPSPVAALASSSSLLAVASGSAVLLYSDSATESFPPASSSTTSPTVSLVRHIAISHDNAYVATVADDKSLRVYSVPDKTLLSTRSIIKKCSDLSFAADNSILVSDKVGDVHLYPLKPREVTGERPLPLALQSDPTLNPDAEYLLGHVSVVTASVLSHDGQYIITADRDEHIRISRFPRSYIVERYLFGTDGFVSALHIPAGQPSTLISGGGEQCLRIWDWTTGELRQRVDIYPSVLPHRRVRSSMRKTRVRRGKRKMGNSHEVANAAGDAQGVAEEPREVAEGALAAEGSFYSSPEGWTLPSGQGVLIRKITTVNVGGGTMVVFASEGAAAIFAFPLDTSSRDQPPIHTLPLDFPILDFTPLPSSPGQILISLDTTWGIFKQNPKPGQDLSTLTPPAGSVTPETQARMNAPLVVAELSFSSGWTVVPDHPAVTSLVPLLPTESASTIAKIQLYPLLSLLPRWPGLEEDDELAGPSTDGPTDASSNLISTQPPASSTQNATRAGAGVAPSEFGGAGEIKRDYSREELEQMGNKMLGRLKSQGVNVDEFFKKKQRKPKGARGKKQKIVQASADADVSDVEEAGEEGEGNAVEVSETHLNA